MNSFKYSIKNKDMLAQNAETTIAYKHKYVQITTNSKKSYLPQFHKHLLVYYCESHLKKKKHKTLLNETMLTFL